MNKLTIIVLAIVFCLTTSIAWSKTDEVLVPKTLILEARKSEETYRLINSLFTQGGNAIEVSDCSHPQFGPHITQNFDKNLKKYVFRFHIHRDHDSDRCKLFGRQRTEIKVYDKSPDWLKARKQSKFIYKWKFKLDEKFQSSRYFTHLFQVKAVGGLYFKHPVITFTTRKGLAGQEDKFELRYGTKHKSENILVAKLSPFLGKWLQVVFEATFAEKGRLFVKITSLENGTELLSYKNTSIKIWKDESKYLRPKWGIYRSLKDKSMLRDEIIDFADIEIQAN